MNVWLSFQHHRQSENKATINITHWSLFIELCTQCWYPLLEFSLAWVSSFYITLRTEKTLAVWVLSLTSAFWLPSNGLLISRWWIVNFVWILCVFFLCRVLTDTPARSTQLRSCILIGRRRFELVNNGNIVWTSGGKLVISLSFENPHERSTYS